MGSQRVGHNWVTFTFTLTSEGTRGTRGCSQQSCASGAEWEAIWLEEFCGFFPLRFPFSPHLTNICYLCSYFFNWNIIALQYCVGFLGNKKERNVDEPRDCHTEWSKSEREKQIPYIVHAYIGNLEKWYRCTYLQGRNREVDVQNGLGRFDCASSSLLYGPAFAMFSLGIIRRQK